MFNRKSGSGQDKEPDLLVGLDLGTSKVTAVVAERELDGDGAQIIGVGQAPSNGMRKGLIVNLEQAVKSVRQAVSEAQNMVGQDIDEVTVAFGGGEMTSVRSKGMVSLGRQPRQVMSLDVGRVIDAALADVQVPENQEILHTIPIEYSLDDNTGIDDPLGMNAVRLYIEVQSILVPKTTVQNVYNCVSKAGLSVAGLAAKPLVSALGVMTQEEAQAGAVVVDIGGGTTGVAVFANGRPRHLALLPIGGDHITNDLGGVLTLPLNKAEELKHSVSLSQNFAPGEKCVVSYNSREHEILKEDLYNIVRCRLDELFNELVRNEIKAARTVRLSSGVILTGGVAKTLGIDDFVAEELEMPTRSAVPIDANRMPPNRCTQEYSSAAGIIRYILERERDPYRYLDNPTDGEDGESRVSGNFRPPLESVPISQKEKKGAGEFGFNPAEAVKKLFKDLF